MWNRNRQEVVHQLSRAETKFDILWLIQDKIESEDLTIKEFDNAEDLTLTFKGTIVLL